MWISVHDGTTRDEDHGWCTRRKSWNSSHRSNYRIFLDILSLFRITYRKKIFLACTCLLGVPTLKRIVFVPNVVSLVHDLPGVFTLKHAIIKKKQNLKYVCLVFTHSNVYYLNRFGLLHDLPSVFYTLKLNIIETKPETCLPGVQALKHLSSKYSFIWFSIFSLFFSSRWETTISWRTKLQLTPGFWGTSPAETTFLQQTNRIKRKTCMDF